MNPPTAHIYADTEANAVFVTFSGGTWTDPGTGEEFEVAPTEISLSPERAREMAFRLTEASLKLEDQP